MKFEIWENSDGCMMIGVPRRDHMRGEILHDPTARLVLRFEADSDEEAKRIRDRYLDDSEPDSLRNIGVSGKGFLFDDYECGWKAGEIVQFRRDYQISMEGESYGYCAQGTKAKVLAGEKEAPKMIWLRILFDLSEQDMTGRILCLPQENVGEILERIFE